MGIGLGIVLIVVGAIFLWVLEVDLQFIDDKTLGVILLVVGIAAVALSLILNAQRSRTTHVEERRSDVE